MTQINGAVSGLFNIGRYGLKGMQIHNESGKLLKVFNELPTDVENWNVALSWAQENINLITK